jgi:SAM-dependent methyltransferase
MNLEKFLHPGWLVTSSANKVLYSIFPKYMSEGGGLLDVGCGTKPHKTAVAPYIDKHIGLDHEDMIHDKSMVDIFADAYNIPVDDGSIDSILCTQVLEHLERPQDALFEFFRVLKKGGYAFITVPFLWHLHEQPRDFFRYTQFGLKYMADHAGFEVMMIQDYGGFMMFVVTEIAYCIYFLTKNKLFRPIQIILFNIFLLVGWLLNFIDPTKNRLPIGYLLVMRK